MAGSVRRAARAACEGFLLLEVLLALAVLSGGIVLVFRAFSSSLRAARTSEARFQAALLVEGRLWDLEQLGHVETVESYDPILNRSVRWDLAALEPQDADVSWRTWELTLVWKEGSREETFSLQSYQTKK